MNLSRFVFIAIMLVAIFAASCAPAAVPTPPPPTAAPAAPAATTAPGAGSVTVNLGPGRDGDQSPGTAVLTAQGDKTQVVVTFKAAAAGVSQPGHIHEGACPGVGAVKYPLTNAVDGKSTTVIDAQLKDLLTGGFAVNFHESTTNISKYVACGNVPKG